MSLRCDIDYQFHCLSPMRSAIRRERKDVVQYLAHIGADVKCCLEVFNSPAATQISMEVHALIG